MSYYLDQEYLKELSKEKNFESESIMNTFRINIGCRELFYRKFY